MKKKIVVLVGIALCIMLLVSPALASDAGTLEIYGNANEDDTIDMRDLTYVKQIFFGKKPETELADAKYDGKINPLDFIQIKLIIVGKEKELTIVDTADRIVTVNEPVERIVVLSGTTAQVVKLLGATDSVVGVDTNTKKNEILFPKLSKLPVVGSYYKPDLEAILTLEPGIILTYVKYAEELENLKPHVTVVRLDLCDLKVVQEQINKLGYIFDRRDKAKDFIGWYEEYMNTIKEKVVGIERPRVYFEHWKPYYTIGVESATHSMVEIAGGSNIFGDLEGYYLDVDPEEVIGRNPEIIIRFTWPEGGYDSDDITELSNVREEIMNRPELANVSAVKNGRVYIIAGDLIATGVKHIVGIAYMAKWFQPNLFEDLDPKAIHQEDLTRFQGLDYDLNKHGVFVYPEPS